MDDHEPKHESSAPQPEGSGGIDRSRMPHRKRGQQPAAEADQPSDEFSELVDEERFSRHRQKLAERDENTTGGVIIPLPAQPEPEPPPKPAKAAPQGKPGRTPIKPPKARKGDLIGVPKAIKKEYEDEDQPPDYG